MITALTCQTGFHQQLVLCPVWLLPSRLNRLIPRDLVQRVESWPYARVPFIGSSPLSDGTRSTLALSLSKRVVIWKEVFGQRLRDGWILDPFLLLAIRLYPSLISSSWRFEWLVPPVRSRKRTTSGSQAAHILINWPPESLIEPTWWCWCPSSWEYSRHQLDREDNERISFPVTISSSISESLVMVDPYLADNPASDNSLSVTDEECWIVKMVPALSSLSRQDGNVKELRANTWRPG